MHRISNFQFKKNRSETINIDCNAQFEALHNTLPTLQINALKRWNQADVKANLKEILKQGYTLKQQKQFEGYLETKLDALLRLLNEQPTHSVEFDIWKNQLKLLLSSTILEAPFLSEDERQFMSNEALLNASEKFLEKLLTYDDSLDFESIGQALRNFWIAVLFQIEYGITPEATSSLFGYSMLYPLTDNLMDHPSLNEADKIAFCKRLTQRLQHKSFDRVNSHESKIFDMLDSIDSEYPPDIFPNVHESILAIHRAQENSLKQQSHTRTPYAVDLLGLSFYKGGTSVLADAYLVKGELTYQQQQLAYDFGALLQLCDDLQDAKSDHKSGHMTIFSQNYKKEPLDILIHKLIQYNEGLSIQFSSTANVIHKNCLLLILGSVLLTPELVSWKMRWQLPKYLPIRVKALKKLKRKFSSDIKRIQSSEMHLKSLYKDSLQHRSDLHSNPADL